jgi:eukaryotic-like serine/threonine-protein kinase
VLADRAEQILASLGYTEPRGDSATGLTIYAPLIPWIARVDDSPHRWDALAKDRPPAFLFWYRTSPRDLVPRQLALHVTATDPPFAETDMHSVTVDMRGRLLGFTSVPRQFDDSPAEPVAPPWAKLFEAADLPMARFSPVTPQWAPRDFADTRAAWEGVLPERPDIRLRVEAAAYRGRAVSFILVGPWTVPTRMQAFQRPVSDRIAYAVLVTLAIVVLAGAILLARHNIRLGRADRRGAFRVALFAVVTELTSWALGYHHVADVRIEMLSFSAIAADAVFLAVVFWIVYAALEPYARRFWPDMLLGWSRLLAGRVRDSRVGRDLLLGITFGMAWFGLDVGRRLLPQLLDYPATVPRLGSDTTALMGAAETFSSWGKIILQELQMAMAVALLFVVLRLVTRRASVAVALGMTIIFYWWSAFAMVPAWWIEFAYEIIAIVLFTVVMIRFGLLAATVMRIVLGLCATIPFTLHVSHWSATPSNWTIAGIIALALFGFYASRAGQPLLGNFELNT